MPTCIIRGAFSSLYSARMRSPSLPVRSWGVRMKNISPPPEAWRSCSRICAGDRGQRQHNSPGATHRGRQEQPYLGFLLDVLQQRLHSVGPGLGQGTKGIFLQGRPMELSQLHGTHVGGEERLAQLHCWDGVLGQNKSCAKRDITTSKLRHSSYPVKP